MQGLANNNPRFLPMVDLGNFRISRPPTPEEWQTVLDNRRLIGGYIRTYAAPLLRMGYDYAELEAAAESILIRAVIHHKTGEGRAALSTYFYRSVHNQWARLRVDKLRFPVSCQGKENRSPVRLMEWDSEIVADDYDPIGDKESEEFAKFLTAVVRKNLTPRMFDIFNHLKKGGKLVELAEEYGVSKQRIAQIDEKARERAADLVEKYLYGSLYS